MSSAASFVQLRRAAREAATDARHAWNPKASAFGVVLLAVVLVPVFVRDPNQLAAGAAGLYTILAAVGLNFAVGMAGIPSLGQGAFFAVGAFAVTLLEVKGGWDPTLAIVAAVILAGLAGAVVGSAAIRLSRPIVAIATWVVAWLVGFTLAAFPGIFGGLQGIPVPEGTLGIAPLGLAVRLTPGIHWELGAVLVSGTLLAYIVLSRASWGLGLSATRDEPAAASVLGVERGRLQFWTFTVSAIIGGAAGALAVQLAGVADPTAYGPLLSVELFAAVLLGGVGRTFGPVAGAAALLLIPRLAEALGGAAGISAERFEPAVASAILVVALVIGRGGVIGWLSALARRLNVGAKRPHASSRDVAGDRTYESEPDPHPLSRWRPGREAPAAATETAPDPILVAEGLAKHFGGVAAVDGVGLHLTSGSAHALIGPNGSGKTTLLRLLGGTLRPDAGTIAFAGTDMTNTPTPERVRKGLVRTLQSVNVFPNLSVLENVLVGASARRRYAGGLRSLVLTPLARAEAKEAREQARALLSIVGLAAASELHPKELSGADQRFLMIASACASFPSLLLLDEPSGGLTGPELQRLVQVLKDLRSRGVTIVLVEHNLRLVRLLADRVTVLDAGRVIAEGTPAEISRNEDVVEAYLGPRGL
ncbi:MAG TPA: branched-chain amino acid ABC transporter ATP-binding protein/permease [Actinomycetota bacterium]